MAVASRGFLEPDEITHFLYAKAVWHDWRNLVNIWGRLGCTGLYALGTPADVIGSRLMAVGITMLTGWGTCVVAGEVIRRQQRTRGKGTDSIFLRHPTAWVWLLFFAQPCVVLNSFTIMTEMPLACAWIWTVAILFKVAGSRGGGFYLASALIGLGGWMRPEGWIAVAVWPLFVLMLLRMRGAELRVSFKRALQIAFISLLIALVPTGLWYILGTMAWHDPRWFIAHWPWSPQSQYGPSGGLFFVSSIVALAIWMWVPVVAGAWALWKNRRGQTLEFCTLVLPVMGFFALHGVLGSLGLFGSLSLPRYFVCVGPMLAVLALVGLTTLEPKRPSRLFPALVMALALAPTAAFAGFGYLPMRPTVEQRRLDIVIDAIEARGPLKSQSLIINHPYVLYRLGMDPDAPAHLRAASREGIASAPLGTLLITDSSVWAYESRPGTRELAQWGYREDESVRARIDAVPDRMEPLTFPKNSTARVRLWVKR